MSRSKMRQYAYLLAMLAICILVWFTLNYQAVEGDDPQVVAERVARDYADFGPEFILIDRTSEGRFRSFEFWDPKENHILIVFLRSFLDLGWQMERCYRIDLNLIPVAPVPRKNSIRDDE